MSIHIAVVGSTGTELDGLLRATSPQVTSLAGTDLLRLAQPGSPCPRVLVLDLRKGHALPPAIALVKKEHPATGVVIVADRLDPALMLEAMRAGVSEWVVDPITQRDLLSAVERAAGRETAPTGEMFAVMGAKGGVGATTLAVNIATALSLGKARTLLIDLHPACGDAALFLGVEPSFSIHDALENANRLDETLLKGLVVKTAAGPDLLASPTKALPVQIDPAKIRALAELACRCYQFVVLDLPRLNASFDDVLGLASSITVVATQELPAIRAGSQIAAALRQRHGGARVRVVMNRFDRANELEQADLERAIGVPISHIFPSHYRLAVEALHKGRPFVSDNHNKLSSSFTAYARSLSQAAPRHEPGVERATGFFGRLTGRR